MISTCTMKQFINAAHTLVRSDTHPHNEGKDTYPLRGRSWVDWVPLGMSHQPVEAAGEEMRGEEPQLPWQQHTCTVNKEREDRNIFIVRGAVYVLVCVCVCVCYDKFHSAEALTNRSVLVSVYACVCVSVCVCQRKESVSCAADWLFPQTWNQQEANVFIIPVLEVYCHKCHSIVKHFKLKETLTAIYESSRDNTAGLQSHFAWWYSFL